MELKGKDGYELTVNADELFVIVTIEHNNNNGFIQQHIFKRREWQTLTRFITFNNLLKIWRALK